MTVTVTDGNERARVLQRDGEGFLFELRLVVGSRDGWDGGWRMETFGSRSSRPRFGKAELVRCAGRVRVDVVARKCKRRTATATAMATDGENDKKPADPWISYFVGTE